eukprot:3190258-Rhodomonas_salina.5
METTAWSRACVRYQPPDRKEEMRKKHSPNQVHLTASPVQFVLPMSCFAFDLGGSGEGTEAASTPMSFSMRVCSPGTNAVQ